jgi:hypothetical protein
MDDIRTEIWDFVYQAGPQSIIQIAEKLQLNHEMVNIAVNHEWFLRQGETVAIATQQGTSADGKKSHDV